MFIKITYLISMVYFEIVYKYPTNIFLLHRLFVYMVHFQLIFRSYNIIRYDHTFVPSYQVNVHLCFVSRVCTTMLQLLSLLHQNNVVYLVSHYFYDIHHFHTILHILPFLYRHNNVQQVNHCFCV